MNDRQNKDKNRQTKKLKSLCWTAVSVQIQVGLPRWSVRNTPPAFCVCVTRADSCVGIGVWEKTETSKFLRLNKNEHNGENGKKKKKKKVQDFKK